MRKAFFLILVMFISINILGQETAYTSRKGSKFFPGHLDISITLNNNVLKYELFNHWYASSYAQLRNIDIPLNEIEKFNASNDSIKFEIKKNSIHLIDKKYHLNKKVKSLTLCATKEKMRKISYAYEIAQKNNLAPYQLYDSNDLNLSQDKFYQKIEYNLRKLKEEIQGQED